MSRLTAKAIEMLVLPEPVALNYLMIEINRAPIEIKEGLSSARDILNSVRFAAMIQFDCDTPEELQIVLEAWLRAKQPIKEKKPE